MHRIGCNKGPMSEAPKKYIQFLDQLIPLLEASPAWFKVWIYILVFLIFATIAATGVFYLVDKEKQLAKRSWDAFVIRQPRANEEIPLGKSKSWMLEGTFPVADKEDLHKKAEIVVQVFKLPDREEVPQVGKARIS